MRTGPLCFHVMLRAGALLAASWLGWAGPVRAGDGDGLLHAMFQDHAVLQRDRPIRVWGHAAPGA